LAEVNWDQLRRTKAPIATGVKAIDDTTNFDEFPEADVGRGDDDVDCQAALRV
jgi:hypothetical protein